jgi:alpha-1,2-mannosyltransferase
VGVGAAVRHHARSLTLAGVLAVLAGTAYLIHRWYELRNHFFDLMVYQQAMRWWDDGNFLYDFWLPDGTQGRLEFTYPPFAAFLLRPLAWLDERQAIWLFSAIGVAALAVSIWWLVRPLADRYSWPTWFTFGVAFVLASGLEPIRHTFDFGQINFVLWLLVLLDLLVLLPRGSRLLGVGIGVATAIKLVPGIFILYLLVSRRWRAAGVAAGTAALVTAMAALFAPRESWVFWTDRLPHGAGVGQVQYTFNQSLLGVLARLAAPDDPNHAVWLLLALPVFGFGLWRAGRAARAGDEVTGLTLAGLVGCLVSPVTWGHHIFWFVPALVVLVDGALRARARGPSGVVGPVRSAAGLVAYALLIYATVTVSVLSLWSFTWHEPGGVVGFVASNWFVWLMLSLLVLLPVRTEATTRARRAGAQVAAPT